MILKNIRLTLKKSLFDSPNPVKLKSQYLSNIDNIFPGVELYLRFLEEGETQESIRLAKKILLRLIFESKFPPPTKLLFNLLDFESRKVTLDDTFPGREHFPHLVNLYLLGIYFYLYHPLLFDYNFKEFKNLRFKEIKNNKLQEVNLNEYSFNDFTETFRLFVLNHDINYPIEKFLGNNEFSLETKKDYLKVYRSQTNGKNKLFNYLAKDSALKVLVKLVIINQQFKHNNSGESLNDYLEKDKVNFSLYPKFDYNRFSEFIKVDKIFGKRSLNNAFQILKKNDFIALLIDDFSFEPLIILEKLKEDEDYHLYHNKKYNRKLKKIIDNEDIVLINLFENKSPILNGKWLFFIENPIQAYNNFIQELYFSKKEKWQGSPKNNLNDHESFDSLISHLELRFDSITNEKEYNDLNFHIFEILFDSFDLTGSELEDMTKIDLFEKVSEPIILNFKNILGDALFENIKSSIKEYLNDESNKIGGKNRIDSINEWVKNENYKALVDNLLDFIKSKSGILSNNILSHLSGDIRDKIDIQLQLFNIWTDLKNLLTIEVDSDLEFDFEEESIKFSDNVYKYFENGNLDFINKDILKNYKPSFVEGQKKFFDHGLISSFLMIEFIYYWKKLLKEDPHNLSSLAINDSFGSQSNVENIFTINQIYKLAVEATAIHNIYPKELKVNTFKTSIKSPFSYLTLLADSLQPWDRKKLVNPSKDKLLFSTSSIRFNIEIRNNHIYIVEDGYDLNLQHKAKIYRDYLGDFLKDAQHLIKLEFKQL